MAVTKQGNVGDKKALADAGMVVGKLTHLYVLILKKLERLWLMNGLKKLDLEELLFYQLTNNSLYIKATLFKWP